MHFDSLMVVEGFELIQNQIFEKNKAHRNKNLCVFLICIINGKK